jgi:uncharacterized protein with PQ loop repeat
MDNIIGFLGSALVLLAYFPQIYHLIKEHCSAGISRYAYALWLLGAIALLAHSVMIRDPVFMLLQSITVICTGAIIIFAQKYKGRVCSTHNLKRAQT